MDIMDIMLARAMTPQGQTDTYVAKANAAAAKAEKAAEDATAAAETLTSASEDLAAAQELLETLQQAEINTLDTEDVDAEIKKQQYTFYHQQTSANTKNIALQITYPDNTTSNYITVSKMYDSTGDSQLGPMTQKATTDALATKADTSALANKLEASDLTNYATKTYVDNAVNNIEVTGGGTTNLGAANADKMVKVDGGGNITTANITETDIVKMLLTSDSYQDPNVIGVEIDYENKTCTRLQGAEGKTKGIDFNSYTMYGGRMRCNVADDGTINAFLGENSYANDGSNGQVMVYQPKFYYRRLPLKVEKVTAGTIIRKERLYLSDTLQPGFKLHPLFIDTEGNELEYALTPAFEGSLNENTELCSIAGVQPSAYLNPVIGELAASRRGAGWHITTMQAESALQMLQTVEYGSMNGQASLEKGICNLDSVFENISCITGSTISLGNEIGAADSSTSIRDGNSYVYNTNGKRAISYRGTENPWGNIWHTIGNLLVNGTGENDGGIPYICTTYNYANSLTADYVSLNFALPNNVGWISAMAKCPDEYDWIFIPIECSSSANSAAPVGDNIWVSSNLSGNKMVAIGGNWRHGDSEGMFFYACDQDTNASLYSFGASLMFIPTKNTTYTANIAKWNGVMV